jgi:hypothetical protein
MNGVLRWGILEALLHLCQQMSNMVQRRCLPFDDAQYDCPSDRSLSMDTDADQFTSNPDSTGPAAPSISTDMDVDHSHTRRQDPPVCPADRPRAHIVHNAIDLTGDRPKVDITEITTTDERQVIRYV